MKRRGNPGQITPTFHLIFFMKKLLIISLFIPLFLISCGKSEEVKTMVNPLVVENRVWNVSDDGVIYTKDLWKWFSITQTERVTTLGYSGSIIFSKINSEDNQIVWWWVDVLCWTGVFVNSFDLSEKETTQCELEQNRIYFTVDSTKSYLDRFYIIRRDSYNPWPNNYLFDTESNKTYQIASRNILQFSEWKKWYYLLTWLEQFDGENQLSFLSHDGSFTDQINDSELKTSIDKFEILENGYIKIFYQDKIKIIPLKLK